MSVMLLSLLLFGTESAPEADKADTLPVPRQVVIMPEYPPGAMRTNRYAVWDYHAVDRFGYFRPVVVHAPYGSYYLINGKPYPWATVYPENYLRQITNR